MPSAFLPFQRFLVFARQTLVNTRQTQIHRDKEPTKRVDPNINLAASKSDTSRCVTPAFCASSLCVMPLSRRLALSHTETAGGVRSIIVVLLEISMENIPDSVYLYIIPKQVFSSFTLCH